ncbi:hypothetical protein Y032_0013g2046 [Ancylostoma ceylanicum]|uniref:Uncharacterized protein n=1 Tax=Ancylostoma ceylanicum TaxID=53326 RepID=A0A016VB74_9BILA|nr:hypothetical protein Y032_0013g2046 [Ancylostoma ceylanicum]
MNAVAEGAVPLLELLCRCANSEGAVAGVVLPLRQPQGCRCWSCSAVAPTPRVPLLELLCHCDNFMNAVAEGAVPLLELLCRCANSEGAIAGVVLPLR